MMIIDKTKLIEAAWLVRDGSGLQGLHAEEAMHDFELLATPDAVLALLSEIDQIKGLIPEWPPRPPRGEGLPRYGVRWNGPQQPLAVPMVDGYWTPWHLADQVKAENEALRHALQAVTDQVEGNIRPTVRDCVNGQNNIQDIYGCCDQIEAIAAAAMKVPTT